MRQHLFEPKPISNINKQDSYLGLKCVYIFLRHPVVNEPSHYTPIFSVVSAECRKYDLFFSRSVITEPTLMILNDFIDIWS
jgi:hypothetical protein